MRRYLSFTVLTFLLAACGGQLSAGDVGGTWTGAVNITGVPLELELTQTGLSLSATLNVGQDAVKMTGTTIESPTATLISLTSQGAEPVRIEASVEGSTMLGTLAVEATGDIRAGRFTATR